MKKACIEDIKTLKAFKGDKNDTKLFKEWKEKNLRELWTYVCNNGPQAKLITSIKAKGISQEKKIELIHEASIAMISRFENKQEKLIELSSAHKVLSSILRDKILDVKMKKACVEDIKTLKAYEGDRTDKSQFKKWKEENLWSLWTYVYESGVQAEMIGYMTQDIISGNESKLIHKVTMAMISSFENKQEELESAYKYFRRAVIREYYKALKRQSRTLEKRRDYAVHLPTETKTTIDLSYQETKDINKRRQASIDKSLEEMSEERAARIIFGKSLEMTKYEIELLKKQLKETEDFQKILVKEVLNLGYKKSHLIESKDEDLSFHLLAKKKILIKLHNDYKEKEKRLLDLEYVTKEKWLSFAKQWLPNGSEKEIKNKAKASGSAYSNWKLNTMQKQSTKKQKK